MSIDSVAVAVDDFLVRVTSVFEALHNFGRIACRTVRDGSEGKISGTASKHSIINM